MQPVSKIVTSGTTLSRLGKQLSAQKALLHQLRQLLPPPLDSQLKAVALQHGNMTLFVPSPVWASRFRYLLPKLQNQLIDHGVQVVNLRTSILPDESAKAIKPRKGTRPMLSHSAGKHLRETAKTINDPSLQEALNRLSRHSGAG